MAEDYDALNRESDLLLKHTMEWTTKEIDQQVQNEIWQQMEKQSQEPKQSFQQQLHIGQTILKTAPTLSIEGITKILTIYQTAPRKRNTKTDWLSRICRRCNTIPNSRKNTETITYLKHYSKVTQGRQSPIQWAKTEILTAKKITTGPNTLLPHMKNRIQNEGKVLGKQ